MNWTEIANIITGSIPGVLAIGIFLYRIERRFNLLMVEHEILIKEHCDRAGIRPHELPTRIRGIR